MFGCSPKKNDIDLSNLPVIKPKKVVNTNTGIKDSTFPNNNEFIEDLDTYQSKDNLLSKFKFGKKDPFSLGETQFNQLSSHLKLTGFLNTKKEKYVFVKYLGNEGIISEDSVGGLNTEFLPYGAKVINIDVKKKLLKISYDNEDFVFEL